jgi:hypothetical protein
MEQVASDFCPLLVDEKIDAVNTWKGGGGCGDLHYISLQTETGNHSDPFNLFRERIGP